MLGRGGERTPGGRSDREETGTQLRVAGRNDLLSAGALLNSSRRGSLGEEQRCPGSWYGAGLYS